MFSGFLGQFKPAVKEPEAEEKTKKAGKSDNAEKFVQSKKAQKFISKWAKKERDGRQLYTKRGIIRLLGALFGGSDDDDDALDKADDVLSKLGGMDGLNGFLAGWKAKSEGLFKGLKSMVGGE